MRRRDRREVAPSQLPWLVRRVLDARRRRSLLDRTLREWMRADDPLAPSPGTLPRLAVGWGNEGWTPHAEFLEAVRERAARMQGPILECGAGLTTLIVGVIAQARGVSLISLEEDPRWAERVRRCLQRHRIESVRVVHAPIRPYEGYHWYSLEGVALPEVIRLVVCDGPSGSTPGGRYGLVPVLGSRLGAGSILLLDDAERSPERDAMARWSTELGVTLEIVRPGRAPSLDYEYAILKVS